MFLFLFLPGKTQSFERRIGYGARPRWLGTRALTLTGCGILDGVAPILQMRKQRFRVAAPFAQSHTSSWQHSNLNQGSLALTSAELNEAAIGEIDLPGYLLTSDCPPAIPAPRPSRNMPLLSHTANFVVCISLLLSEHIPQSPRGARNVVSLPG